MAGNLLSFFFSLFPYKGQSFWSDFLFRMRLAGPSSSAMPESESRFISKDLSACRWYVVCRGQIAPGPGEAYQPGELVECLQIWVPRSWLLLLPLLDLPGVNFWPSLVFTISGFGPFDPRQHFILHFFLNCWQDFCSFGFPNIWCCNYVFCFHVLW